MILTPTHDSTMQHPDSLKMVETRAHEKDRNWVTRAKSLLPSDCWSVDTSPDDRPDGEALLAERVRLQAAGN